MALQRLNIGAKKSFPGLYSFDNAETRQSTKSTAVHLESPSRSDLPQGAEDCDLADFGAKLERCKEPPSRESPSKRKKLFGSLRSLRSLANLHSSPTKTKQPMTPRPESPVKQRDVRTTPLPMSPSLALLNFEQSPSDKPMFELAMRRRSVSDASLEVQHSSPMTVPGSARQMTPYNTFPSATDLPAGTIPDTPGPMQRAFNRDPANHVPWQNASPTPMERYAPSTPVLTPLPGTNLSIGDIGAELAPLPPSIDPFVVQPGHGNPGYFDISVDESGQMDNADMLNGLACLQLAGEHDETVNDENKPSGSAATHVPIGRYGTAEEMRPQCKDAKHDTVGTLVDSQGRTRAHRRKQQAKNLREDSRALGIPKHHQILPLRPKQQDEDGQDRVRKDSHISESWETGSDGRSTGTAPEHSHDSRTANQSCKSSPSSAYFALAPEGQQGTENGSDALVGFAHVVWGSLSPVPGKAWDQATGLYDSTGCGDSSGSATPCEPDEGIQDVHTKTSSASLSVDGDGSGQKMTNHPWRGENLYPEAVREFPSTAHAQRNYDSLESIYRAYAYPVGDRVRDRSNSAGGDVLMGDKGRRDQLMEAGTY